MSNLSLSNNLYFESDEFLKYKLFKHIVRGEALKGLEQVVCVINKRGNFLKKKILYSLFDLMAQLGGFNMIPLYDLYSEYFFQERTNISNCLFSFKDNIDDYNFRDFVFKLSIYDKDPSFNALFFKAAEGVLGGNDYKNLVNFTKEKTVDESDFLVLKLKNLCTTESDGAMIKLHYGIILLFNFYKFFKDKFTFFWNGKEVSSEKFFYKVIESFWAEKSSVIRKKIEEKKNYNELWTISNILALYYKRMKALKANEKLFYLISMYSLVAGSAVWWECFYQKNSKDLFIYDKAFKFCKENIFDKPEIKVSAWEFGFKEYTEEIFKIKKDLILFHNYSIYLKYFEKVNFVNLIVYFVKYQRTECQNPFVEYLNVMEKDKTICICDLITLLKVKEQVEDFTQQFMSVEESKEIKQPKNF
jgi:hypothetical protein